MTSGRIALWGGILWLSCGTAFGGETARTVATVVAGFVNAITVTSGGSGYVSEPAVTITGGGGSGASAKAILSGDTVSQVVVLMAGRGYTSAPTVDIEPPPKELRLDLKRGPELKVEGAVGSAARVEWSVDPSGPWTAWSNVVVSGEGVLLVDLTPGSDRRFYRAVVDPKPVGPDGFAWIPPGTFVMGSPGSGDPRLNDEVQHTVTLTQGFWMSDHEVTQREYQEVMGDLPSFFPKDLSQPVELVSWNDAVDYCHKLTVRERAAGRITDRQAYRLPTEAEWEFAARAGTTGDRYGELDAIAWWSGNSARQPHPVKQKVANAWGLHDMLGNVSEWCSDWHGEYPTGSVTDPTGPSSGQVRVARGGSWAANSWSTRSAIRARYYPHSRDNYVGFRPVLGPVR